MKVRFVPAVETIADPLRDLVRRQQARRFDDPPLAVHPFRLDRVEPRTLDRQETDDDPYPLPFPLDRPVVRPDPRPHRLAHMPTGVVPHQQERRLPLLPPAVGSTNRGTASSPRSPVAHPRSAATAARCAAPGIPVPHQQPIAGERFRVGIARVPPSARPTASARPPPPNSTDAAARPCSTRPRPRSRAPSRDALFASRISRSRRFFFAHMPDRGW